MSRGIDKHAKPFRRPFVIREPESVARRACEEETVRISKETISHVMEALVNARLAPLNFEESYRAGYNLTIYKHSAWVLDEAVKALRRLNLKPYDDSKYFKMAVAMHDILLFPNKTVAIRGDLETTIQASHRLRGERGLQLWRLLITKWAAGLGRVDIWKARMAEWRLAFDMVCFRPDEAGAQGARHHFLATASLHNFS